VTLARPKFRILHIITGLEIGGAEMMLYKLLSSMDLKKYEPEVISLINIGPIGKKIQELGIPVHGVGMQAGRPDPISIWRLISTARKIQPGLVQGWMYHGNLAAQFLKIFLPEPLPVLWNIRHSVYSLLYEKKMTRLLIRMGARLSNRPVKIIYNSRVSAEQHKTLGYASPKIVVIPNGFDTELFAPSEEIRSQVRQELGLPSSAKLIGLFGRYDPMKDHANFICAAGILVKSYPEVIFLLAGKGVDDENKNLADLIKKQNLSKNFHLLGERNDMNRLCASLDIASSSSFSEGFPNVIGEAMASGVPCVATDVGDSSFLVGDTGKMVPPRDPEALAKGLKDLLDLGVDGQRKLGKRARERIVSNFSLNKITDQYELLYHDLLFGNLQKSCLPQNSVKGTQSTS
jgi:glycosyltransferase involved in cell wall biosynthesis